jgi:hypothetical protein
VIDSAGQKPLHVPDRNFLSRFPDQVFVARMVEMRKTDIKILLKTKST